MVDCMRYEEDDMRKIEPFKPGSATTEGAQTETGAFWHEHRLSIYSETYIEGSDPSVPWHMSLRTNIALRKKRSGYMSNHNMVSVSRTIIG